MRLGGVLTAYKETPIWHLIEYRCEVRAFEKLMELNISNGEVIGIERKVKGIVAYADERQLLMRLTSFSIFCVILKISLNGL